MMSDELRAKTRQQWMNITGSPPPRSATGDRILSGSTWLVMGATMAGISLKLRSPWLVGDAASTDTADSAPRGTVVGVEGGITAIVTELKPLLIACLLSVSLT